MTCYAISPDNIALLKLIEELKASLAEAEHTLEAIRSGDIDALMISNKLDDYDLHTLQSADHPYQVLIERLQEGAITLADDGSVLYGNDTLAKMIGISKKTMIGQKLQQFLSEDDTLEFRRMLIEAQCNSARGEITLCSVGGAKIPINISLGFLRNKSDQSLVCGVLTDITDQKNYMLRLAEANEALVRITNDLAHSRDIAERANSAKTRFLTSMSHELRTPLHGVLGYSQLLRLGGDLNNKQRTQVDAMATAGTHLLQMINSVLTLSEVEAEHVELRPVEIDVEVIIGECLDSVRPAAEAKELQVDMAIAPDIPVRIVIDKTKLQQILLNLLGNAVKFTKRGSVEMCLWLAPGNLLQFNVTDTGPGISAEGRGRLFHDFERFASADTMAVEGTGLGLALSARLAATMGGSLGHQDNPEGGSVFFLKLPLIAGGSLPESTAHAPNSPNLQSKPGSTHALKILIVDDVAMNREIAGAFLRSVGHEITYAEGGAQAVELVAHANFDAVLMDVRMPEVDGLEATRRIRALAGKGGRVPIVALTAQTYPEQLAACRLAGMDSHLAKPFTLESLIEGLESSIARA